MKFKLIHSRPGVTVSETVKTLSRDHCLDPTRYLAIQDWINTATPGDYIDWVDGGSGIIVLVCVSVDSHVQANGEVFLGR